MISFKVILLILLFHWAADFLAQTNEQATQKSINITQLFWHACTYSIIWVFGAYCLFDRWQPSIMFTIATFGFHFWTDFLTSRVGKPYWEKGDYHNGFAVVGFDQILHYVQLFICYIWLSK